MAAELTELQSFAVQTSCRKTNQLATADDCRQVNETSRNPEKMMLKYPFYRS